MLTIANLSHTYRTVAANKCLSALHDINLTIADGEFVCILGPSGSGKSTLLDIIAGFLSPSEGQVRLDSRPVTRPDPARGVVFQEPHLFPWLTVQENVAFGLICQGVPKERSKRIAREMLELVGLAKFSHLRPHELSGGMKQRVAIARVLACDPKVLLLDEPFSALDAITRRKLQDELLQIWYRQRKTIIFVTHHVEEAIYLAERIIVFHPHPGRIKGEVTVDLARPRLVASPEFQAYRERITQLMTAEEGC